MRKIIKQLATIRRRLKYFFSDQRKKQKKIDELFNSRKKSKQKNEKNVTFKN